MKTTRFAEESAAQAQAEAQETTLSKKLALLENPSVSEHDKWKALSRILREWMLAEGVELDLPFIE